MAEAEASAQQGQPRTLREVLSPLEQITEEQRTFTCRNLLTCLGHLEAVQLALKTRTPQTETLKEQEAILLTYLAGYYAGITATPTIIRGHLLEPELMASNLAAPFAARRQDGGAVFGVPTKLDPDIVCDNRSELLRMAVAAIISFYVYMNFKQGPGDMPADEVVLIYSTISITSTCQDAQVASLDAELAELEGPAGFGCAQIRWLMHYIRSRVMQCMADVYYLTSNKQKHAECFAAIQKDAQYMAKVAPSNPVGYSLYARQAMNLQLMPLAVALLTKGLTVAAEVNDDCYSCAMAYQKAAAMLLGGAGEEVEAAQVQQLLQLGAEKRDSVLSWFPAELAEMAVAGEPDRTLVVEKLVPEWEKRQGGQVMAEASGRVPVLQGLLYVTRAPTSIPPGALGQLQSEAAAGQGAPVEAIDAAAAAAAANGDESSAGGGSSSSMQTVPE